MTSVKGLRLTPLERRASISLAGIFALRMLGLFLVLPVLSLYADTLPGSNNSLLLGIALGIYGLTQALMQIPLGLASDHFGRKRIMVIGLLIFAFGSFVAAEAETLRMMAVGRALQGAGAISAAITAMVADTTRAEVRTRAMAMIGASIGLTFACSLVFGPILYDRIGMDGLFWGTGVLALLAIAVVLFVVPAEVSREDQARQQSDKPHWRDVLLMPELLRLNLGIFLLHLMQVAMFVVIPVALVKYVGLAQGAHWKVYLPALVGSLALMVPAIIMAEKYGRMRLVFISAIVVLLCTQTLLALGWETPTVLLSAVFLFFLGFNILEACLPSLVSRVAPPQSKGLALGVYNTTQSLGFFAGGILGGHISAFFGNSVVFSVCAILVLIWLVVVCIAPPLEKSRLLRNS
jgi:MFS family permease